MGASEEQLCWNEKYKERIVPHVGDLSLPSLGISSQNMHKFLQILASVECVLHVGALVNWILPYSQLRETNVFGTSEILKLISATNQKIPFHFISTIGVTYQGKINTK